MEKVTIYHNPRCSKSRQTLELLRSRGVEPDIIEYLKAPPDAATLRKILKMLGLRAIGLVRRQEPEFAKLGLAQKADDDEAIIAALVKHPILIERPIVVKGSKAVVGRPPENALRVL